MTEFMFFIAIWNSREYIINDAVAQRAVLFDLL